MKNLTIPGDFAVYSFLKGFEIPINMSKFVYVCDFLNILLDEVFEVAVFWADSYVYGVVVIVARD